MEKTLGIDAHAELPKFVSRTFVSQDRSAPVSANASAPAFGKRKAALFATCFVNYNKPETGMAARAVLNHIGVETRAAYPDAAACRSWNRASWTVWPNRP
jgi:glycerol-3-phosphate dehydrogenase subunit C